jgi:hypothetical protein
MMNHISGNEEHGLVYAVQSDNLVIIACVIIMASNHAA